NERGLVGKPQFAGQRQHGLALHLIAEGRNGGEVQAKRKLVRGEQRPARYAEIGVALFAAVAECAIAAPGFVSLQTATPCRVAMAYPNSRKSQKRPPMRRT